MNTHAARLVAAAIFVALVIACVTKEAAAPAASSKVAQESYPKQ